MNDAIETVPHVITSSQRARPVTTDKRLLIYLYTLSRGTRVGRAENPRDADRKRVGTAKRGLYAAPSDIRLHGNLDTCIVIRTNNEGQKILHHLPKRRGHRRRLGSTIEYQRPLVSARAAEGSRLAEQCTRNDDSNDRQLRFVPYNLYHILARLGPDGPSLPQR